MIRYNPEKLLDTLAPEELKELIKAHESRYRIIVSMDKFALFRYKVDTDTMYYWGEDPNGGNDIVTAFVPNYTQKRPSFIFAESDKDAIPDQILRMVNDPNEPTMGAAHFHHRDGHLLECEFTAVKDQSGKVTMIVGQIIDYFRTPAALQQTIENMNEYIQTIEGLKTAYETVLSISLMDYSFKVIKATPAVTQGAKQCSNVLELSKIFCQYFVEDQYQPGFQDFVDPKTLAERIYGQKYISYDYVTKNIGWVHARIVPTEYDSDGNVVKAILTTEETNENTQRMDYLRVAAETDALTGLNNRVKGERVINESLAQKKPSAFAIFDCDHFKRINDTLGHPVGDIVLTEIAKAMNETFPAETTMRLGGDEFVIYITSEDLLPANPNDILKVFDAFKKRIAQINIPQLKGRRITLSGGVALYNGIFPSTFDKLYHRADKALYHSKLAHNGVISYN